MATTFIDLTGKRFERLLVLRRCGSDKFGGATFLCICDCGTETCVSSGRLRGGTTRSCGCLARDMAKKLINRITRNPYSADSPIKHIYNVYRSNAKKRGLSLEVSFEMFRLKIFDNCAYCGAPPSNKSVYKNGKRQEIPIFYNGLDRIDNSQGYFDKNICTSCVICNRAKREMSEEDFYEYRKRIASFFQNHPVA